MPSAISCTSIRPSVWCSVVSMLPGSAAVPAERNQAGPKRAIRRQMGQGLDVLHQGGPVGHAPL